MTGMKEKVLSQFAYARAENEGAEKTIAFTPCVCGSVDDMALVERTTNMLTGWAVICWACKRLRRFGQQNHKPWKHGMMG